VKTLLQKLINTGFFDIFGFGVINRIVTFSGNMVLVRVLAKDEYGIFTYAWNIYNILFLLNGLGTPAGALQLGSENAHNSNIIRGLFDYAMRIGLLADGFLAVVIFLIGCFMPLKMNGAGYLLKLLCFLPFLQFLLNMYSVYLRSQKRNTDYAHLSTINSVMTAFFSVVGAFLLREKGLVIGYYIANLVSLIWVWKTLKVKLIFRKQKLIPSLKKDLFSISVISVVNDGLSQLLFLLDVFVLGIIIASEEIIANYKVATMIPTALTFIPATFITYIYPYFAEHREDGKWCWEHFKKSLLAMSLMNGVISASLFYIAPVIVKIAFGMQYMDVVPIFRFLLINYFISGSFNLLSGNLLVTQRKLKFNLLIAFFSSSLNIIANYYFINMCGVWGAAYATMMATILASVLNTAYLLYIFKKNRIG